MLFQPLAQHHAQQALLVAEAHAAQQAQGWHGVILGRGGLRKASVAVGPVHVQADPYLFEVRPHGHLVVLQLLPVLRVVVGV